MKIIVAGGRSFNNYPLLSEKLSYYFQTVNNPVIVCGEARGADSLGRRYAEENELDIVSCPADWTKGRGAGYRRNEYMARIADGLIAFWDGESKGTKHMIDTMKRLGKPVRIVRYKE